MKIILRASHKTDAMPLPADGTVFAFFGADSPLSIHFLTVPSFQVWSDGPRFNPCLGSDEKSLRASTIDSCQTNTKQHSVFKLLT